MGGQDNLAGTAKMRLLRGIGIRFFVSCWLVSLLTLGVFITASKAAAANRRTAGVGMLCVAVSLVASIVFAKRPARPVLDLESVVRRVAQGDLSARAAIRRGERIEGLAVSFNAVADSLQRMTERNRELQEQVDAKERAHQELSDGQKRLIELSRRSGMAEVATGVLHNVGNVLNSVNVSATLVASRLRDLRLDNLAATVDMLLQHRGDLPEFLARDSKGARLLPYLTKLARHLNEEREALSKEVELLRNHVGNIKEVVATQQKYAKGCGLTEEVSLCAVVEDAFRMVEAAFERHHIDVEYECEDLPAVAADKHKVLQIVLNLLRNAAASIQGSGLRRRVVAVRVYEHESGRVRIEVKDSGVGLTRENLTRIFAHGFTQKRDGHGFGLHAGALAAQEMGGALWAESDGPDRGATFTLELPTKAPVRAETSIA